MPLDRPHLLIPNSGRRLEFTPKGGGGKPTVYPAVNNRAAVADRILGSVRAIAAATPADGVRLRNDNVNLVPVTVKATREHGINKSIPGNRRNDVLSSFGHAKAERMNVALDPLTIENFEAAADRYVNYDKGRKPNHFYFFEAEPEIAPTRVEDLWASHWALPKAEDELVWEVWVQPVAEARFRAALEELEIPNPPRGVEFADVRVIGLPARRADLDLLVQSASIAQLRPASSLNTGLMTMPSGIQALAVQAAAGRVRVSADDAAAAVCVLDTGVEPTHPLLAPVLKLATSVGGVYPPGDWMGHGSSMAGIALYEDLPSLVKGGAADLDINLESVALEPPAGAATMPLPAARLRAAVAVAEGASQRSRTFCLAMNAPVETQDGSPSSLSSELDALAFDVASPRLFCVAAGNLTDAPPKHGDYQALNDVSGILSPAQAWNALTVAACTDLVGAPPPSVAVAPSGDLSPWSRTAVNWERRHKPASKPDVVFEGGNQMRDLVSDAVAGHGDLCLLTTSNDLAAPLTLTGQTSAATAAVAGLAARLQRAYPRLWPETIRGLIVHSADHSPAMKARARSAAGAEPGSETKALLSRFGYGKPDRAMAMQNAEDALTLVVQGSLLPLRLNEAGTSAVLGYMKFHALPWPIEVLQELEQTPAELRVTLSYFVEPNPGASIRGQVDLYPSHGLDFDVKRPDESDEQAIARINAAHQPAGRASTAPSLDWTFGKYRGRGGLKHDRLTTSAADLARMGGISIFPRKGWWGEDLARLEEQIRYALIVTIRTPDQEIYTEIANEIAV